MKSPCYMCPDRRQGCHDACPRYRDFRAHIDAVNAKKGADGEVNAFFKDNTARLRRLTHGRNER